MLHASDFTLLSFLRLLMHVCPYQLLHGQHRQLSGACGFVFPMPRLITTIKPASPFPAPGNGAMASYWQCLQNQYRHHFLPLSLCNYGKVPWATVEVVRLFLSSATCLTLILQDMDHSVKWPITIT